MPKGHCELRLKSLAHRIYLPPKLHGKESAGGYTAALFTDSYTQLILEKENDTFSHTLPDNLSGLRLSCEIVNDVPYFAVSGKSGAGYYLLVARARPNEVQILLSEFADKITQEKEKITLVKARRDIANRAFITVYDSVNFKALDQYYAYIDGKPKTPDKKDAPRALFEAVKCGDFAAAAACMTASLGRIMTPAKLTEFFSEYDRFVENDYYDIPDGFVLASKSNAAVFSASFNGNLIDNIEEAD